MKRIESLDGLKYLLIILVIVGHFIESSRYSNPFSSLIYSVIYSFHMPLFVILNGFFYKHRSLKEEILKCLPFLEICLVSNFFYILLSSHHFSLYSLLDYRYTPSWYLLSLVVWRLISSVSISVCNIKWFFVCSIAIEFFSFVLIRRYGGILSIMRICQFLPFFLLGYILKETKSFFRYPKEWNWLVLLFLGGAFVVVILSSCRFQHEVFFQRDGLFDLVRDSGMSVLRVLLFRYLMIACSVLISLSILLLSFRSVHLPRLSRYGKSTLFIYFGQTCFYPLVNKYCIGLFPQLIASVVAVLLLTFLSQKKISKVLLNPVTCLVKLTSSRKD